MIVHHKKQILKMLSKYINRRGESHYLRAVEASKGGIRYYIVKDKNKYKIGELLKDIPDNFEFYENPEDGKVRFRKKINPIFSKLEKSIVELVMKKHESVDDYIIDLEKDCLKIYIGHLKIGDFGWKTKEEFIQYQSYNVMLKIVKSKKQYLMQRFCRFPRIGWITIETNEDLKYLCDKYCYHIDKESLMKFWIEGEED